MRKIRFVFLLMFVLFVFVCYPNSNVHASNELEVKSIITDLNIEEMSVGEEYVFYSNEETGEEVYIVIESQNKIMPAAVDQNIGNDGWSAGTVPSTATGLIVRFVKGTNSFSYKVDWINGQIARAYDFRYITIAMDVQDDTLSVPYKVPTRNIPARASATWKATTSLGGTPIGTVRCYLNFEVNYRNQVRVSWAI